MQELEKEFPGDFEKIAPYVKGENYRVVFQETGNLEDGVWSCGPVLGLIDDIPTCQELIDSIVTEAEDVIKNQLSENVV